MPIALRYRRTAAAIGMILIGAAVSPVIAAPDRQVTIVNGTRTVMVSLQLRTRGGAWSEILDRKRLGVRQEIAFKFPPGPCDHYEIRAVFDDGHAVNKTDQNLCKSPYLLTEF